MGKTRAWSLEKTTVWREKERGKRKIEKSPKGQQLGRKRKVLMGRKAHNSDGEEEEMSIDVGEKRAKKKRLGEKEKCGWWREKPKESNWEEKGKCHDWMTRR
jgi:hypothetical protein